MASIRPLAFAVLASAALAGCVSTQIDEIPPSLETLRLLREQAVPPLALGSFRAGPGGVVRKVVIRGSDMHAPKGGDFAGFLGATFESELRAAGKLDPAAPLQLSGTLMESRASENLSRGTAALGADLVLTKNGQIIFARGYRVETQWQSDFIGAIAIPEAFRRYNGLYAELVRKALSDPDLIAAAKR